MKPQIIKTPHGEKMVIIPLADYEALIETASDRLEDAADVAIFDQRMAELATDDSDKLPIEVSALLVKGDSLLKAVRKWKDMTQAQVAESARIGQGYYSEIENGFRRGSTDVLTAIARALNVPEKWLI